MNRRTALRSASTVAVAGLAGCLDGVADHFNVQAPIELLLMSEASGSYEIRLDAREQGTQREIYEEGFTITPEENVYPQNLQRTEQVLRVSREGGPEDAEAIVETIEIHEDHQAVVITVHDDDLEIELSEREEDAEEIEETVDEEDE